MEEDEEEEKRETTGRGQAKAGFVARFFFSVSGWGEWGKRVVEVG